MKQYLLFITLISVILVSGCIQTTTTALGNGLVITDVYSSIEDVEGKDRSVRLSLEIENQGGASTDKVLACLMGSNFPGSTSEQMWGNESSICQKATRKLSAADMINNMPGGAARFSWTLKSPWISYPQERTDEFTTRVFYEYKTQTSADVWVYSESEIRSAKQKGESIPETLEIRKTIGPVDISLNTIQPVRADDAYFTLRITVSNIGGSTVFNQTGFDWDESNIPSLTEEKLNQVALSFSYPSGLTPEACDDIVELKKGDTRTISCDFTINNPGSITTKTSYPIIVTATYGYFIDNTIFINVKGKKGQSS